MIVKINEKFKEGNHGPWLPLEEVPSKVLLETGAVSSDPNAEIETIATGKPCIKIDSVVFYFGQKPENISKYRVLALGTIAVCTAE